MDNSAKKPAGWTAEKLDFDEACEIDKPRRQMNRDYTSMAHTRPTLVTPPANRGPAAGRP